MSASCAFTLPKPSPAAVGPLQPTYAYLHDGQVGNQTVVAKWSGVGD
jgi:hypothetical protein